MSRVSNVGVVGEMRPTLERMNNDMLNSEMHRAWGLSMAGKLPSPFRLSPLPPHPHQKTETPATKGGSPCGKKIFNVPLFGRPGGSARLRPGAF
jgi:hypothetical protein